MAIKLHILTAILCFGIFSQAGAQIDLESKRFEDYPIRYILNKFSVNLSMGYGRTLYRHSLEDFAYIRNGEGSFIIDKDADLGGTAPVSGYSNWFTGVEPVLLDIDGSLQTVPFRPIDNPVNNPLLQNDYDMLYPEDGSIAMRGAGNSIPVTLNIFYNLRRLRLGGGITMDFHSLSDPVPKEFFSRFPEPETKTKSFITRYYGLVGYSIYEYMNYAFAADVRFGKVNLGGGFDKETVSSNTFVNVGVRVENVFSEYFRVFARPSVEFKSYTVTLPGNDAQATAIKHKAPTIFLEIGISINYPDLPRSPIKSDKTQMKHFITDPKSGEKREFRGQPFWKKQDPKYGELYPELLKKKKKNL